jgi:hypothetical protein
MTGQLFNNFEDVAPSPFWWWLKAQDLHSAANVIWRDHEGAVLEHSRREAPLDDLKVTVLASTRLRSFSVYLLLLGLSFENLFKALIVGDAPELVKDGILHGAVKTHHLVHLSSVAELTLSEQERELLDRVTETVVWAGRYPVARKDSENTMRRRGDGVLYLPGTLFDGEFALLEQLWERACTEFDARFPSTPFDREAKHDEQGG